VRVRVCVCVCVCVRERDRQTIYSFLFTKIRLLLKQHDGRALAKKQKSCCTRVGSLEFEMLSHTKFSTCDSISKSTEFGGR
jgi:hypothetical protein